MKIVFISLSCIFLFTSFQNEKRSKMVLSSRFFHPRNLNDSVSSLEAIKFLKPDRLDWTYTYDTTITKIYHKLNLPFSLAINPQLPDSGIFTTKKARIRDSSGKFYIASWMKSRKMNNPFWGCVNDYNFYKNFLNKTLILCSMKPYAIFVDDSEFNYKLKREGLVGCFCDSCVVKYLASKYNMNLKRNINSKDTRIIFNAIILKSRNSEKNNNTEINLLNSYSKFQEQSVISFLSEWKKAVITKFPKMLFLTNNSQGEWNNIYKIFDGGIAEINAKLVNNSDLDLIYKRADDNLKSQLLTINTSTNFETHYKLLEYNIANNRDYIVPWDLYIHGLKDNHRLYFNLSQISKAIINIKNNLNSTIN